MLGIALRLVLSSFILTLWCLGKYVSVTPFYLHLLCATLVDKFEATFIFHLLVKVQLSLSAQNMSRGDNNLARLWASAWVGITACSHTVWQKFIFHHLLEAITSSSTPYYDNSCFPVWIFLMFFHTLLSWIPDVTDLLVPCDMLDECQKMAMRISL